MTLSTKTDRHGFGGADPVRKASVPDQVATGAPLFELFCVKELPVSKLDARLVWYLVPQLGHAENPTPQGIDTWTLGLKVHELPPQCCVNLILDTDLAVKVQ